MELPVSCGYERGVALPLPAALHREGALRSAPAERSDKGALAPLRSEADRWFGSGAIRKRRLIQRAAALRIPRAGSALLSMRIIEIAGCNSKNLGDLLMLDAVVRELSAMDPDLGVAARPKCLLTGRAPGSRLAVLPLLRLQGRRLPLKRWLNEGVLGPLSRVTCRFPGYASAAEVDGLIDICGYKYGGVWGSAALAADVRTFAEVKRRGHRVVLLPKTLGPFDDPVSARLMRELVEVSDWCGARDRVSQLALLELGINPERCPVFPDFTASVPGRRDDRLARYEGRPLIIPNYRMVDSVPGHDAARYLERLSVVSDVFSALGGPPAILLHELGKDRLAGEALARACGLDLLAVGDAAAVKGLIGRARAVYSDRLHGVINGLSQGVVSLTTGWNFKYRELLADYDAGELELPQDPVDRDTLGQAIRDRFARWAEVEVRVERAAARVRQRNAEMWRQVCRLLAPAAFGRSEGLGDSGVAGVNGERSTGRVRV